MTDNEIIKALECCSMGSYPACRDCPYHGDYVNRGCINKRNADIKNLINRQKEEIERLNLENLQMVASIKNLKVGVVKEKVIEAAGMIVAQVSLEEVREHRRENGLDPVYWFSEEKLGELCEYGKSLMKPFWRMITEMVKLFAKRDLTNSKKWMWRSLRRLS